MKNFPRASSPTSLSADNDNNVEKENQEISESQDAEDMYADSDEYGEETGYIETIIINGDELQPFNIDKEKIKLYSELKNQPLETVFKAKDENCPTIKDSDIVCETPPNEPMQKTCNILKKLTDDAVSLRKAISVDAPTVREYGDKKAVIPKPNYAKAKKKTNSKVMFFVILGLCVAIFMGVQANSYYWFSGGKASGVACAFAWIMQENMPTASQINWGAFFSGFGIWSGIMGVVGLFIYLDNDAKKNSRVGHEHGASHLGTKSDFKGFQNRFMEK